MANLSNLKVQLTLDLEELEQLVALLNLAGEHMSDPPVIIEEITDLYFHTMGELEDGIAEFEFEPE